MALLNEKRFSFISNAPGLPEETFAVVSFRGFEGLSIPYEFDILLVSENPEIDLDQMMQNPARFLIHREDGRDVPYHGILRQFEQMHEARGYTFYRALLAPKLWWLSLTRHQQVHLGETVSDVVKKTLLDGGLTTLDFDFRLQGTYPEMEYVCQYGETHLNFVARWLEREGIYYFFEQTTDGEKVVFTDTRISHTGLAPGGDLIYSPPSGLDDARRGEVVHAFTCRQRQLPRKVLLRDYNYEKPSLEITGSAEVDPQGRGEAYLYGEHFLTPEEGTRLAAIRAEELLCRRQEFFGESTVPFLTTGYTFTLNDHYRTGFNRKYLLTEVTHEGNQTGYLISGVMEALSNKEKRVFYHNSFTAIPADTQFRPERKAVKPRIPGTMNALIDAEGSGDYAELDEQGRYKVRLPFDIDDAHGAGKASHFIRMSQPYAGSDYGVHFPLHKGTDVLLTFIDGDPDRPVISGATPNPETVSPVTSGNQTESVFRDSYGNELIFDSTPGDEHIRLYSPNHKSKLVLGRSIVSTTESDGYEWKGGNSAEYGAGNTFGAFAGNSAEVKAGISGEAFVGLGYELSIAGKHEAQIGYSMGLRLGPEYKYEKGATVEINNDDQTSISQKSNVISAKETLNLIGGAGGLPTTNTSIAWLDSNKITLTVGKNQNPDQTTQEKWRTGAMIATPVVAAALIAIFGGCMGMCIEYEDEDERKRCIIGLSIVEGLLIVANIIIMALLAKDATVEKVSHYDHPDDDILSYLKLHDTDGVDLGVYKTQKKTATIELKQDGSVAVNSSKDATSKKITLGVGDLAGGDDTQAARVILQDSGSNIEIRSGKTLITLKKDGDITITSAKKISITGEDAITITSKKDITLDATKAQVVAKGGVKHKSFTIAK